MHTDTLIRFIRLLLAGSVITCGIFAIICDMQRLKFHHKRENYVKLQQKVQTNFAGYDFVHTYFRKKELRATNSIRKSQYSLKIVILFFSLMALLLALFDCILLLK